MNPFHIKVIDNQNKVYLSAEAQDSLGDIIYASFPKVNQAFEIGEPILELEAEKAVVEYEAPVKGSIRAINEDALKNIEVLNEPMPWLFTIS